MAFIPSDLSINDVTSKMDRRVFFGVSAAVLLTSAIVLCLIGSNIYNGSLPLTQGIVSAATVILSTAALIAFAAQCIRCAGTFKGQSCPNPTPLGLSQGCNEISDHPL